MTESKRTFFDTYTLCVRYVLPTPFTIAVLLTLLTLLIVYIYTTTGDSPIHSSEILALWSSGLWTSALLAFTVQMMLILVLGHVLALSPSAAYIIDIVTIPCNSTGTAAAIVSFTSMLVALFNWGLGIIYGAILARKVGEKASREKFPLNYNLVAAAGYSGLMIWHGGFSGSALVKVAESGHLMSILGGGETEAEGAGEGEPEYPDKIPLTSTLLSNMNIAVTVAILVLNPLVLFFVAQQPIDCSSQKLPTDTYRTEMEGSHEPEDPLLHKKMEDDEKIMNGDSKGDSKEKSEGPPAAVGAENLDRSAFFSRPIGLAVFAYCIYLMVQVGFMNYFVPNNINLLLFALGLTAHSSIEGFNKAVNAAIVGAGGILTQFPLYFGIMGLMKGSGFMAALSQFFVTISTSKKAYLILTFVSAGIVNLLVPSGGGQWAIQGPIIMTSAPKVGVELYKGVLALAYGDEITNMIQPFWALPLLGITGTQAKDILPYTLIMFLNGTAVMVICLAIFG